MPAIESCNTWKEPLSTVRRYRKMTLRMIQPIGNRPFMMPRPVALAAMSAGMPNTSVTVRKAAISAMMAAMWAWTLPAAMRPSSTTIGTAATSVEATALPSGL